MIARRRLSPRERLTEYLAARLERRAKRIALQVAGNGNGGEPGGSVAWADITGKPSTFAPSTHTHDEYTTDAECEAIAIVQAEAEVLEHEGLADPHPQYPTITEATIIAGAEADTRIGDHESALDPHPDYALSTELTSGLAGKANTSHAHAISDVTNLQTSLNNKSDAGHTHAQYQLSAEKGTANGYASLGADGKVPTAQLPASGGGGITGGRIMVTLHRGVAALVVTNLPAADREFPTGTLTHYRASVDLGGYVEGRLCVIQNALASAGSKIRLQYSAAFTGPWTNLGPEVLLLTTGNANGAGIEGSWASLAAGALGDVWIRLVTSLGNGVADPSFFCICAEFR